MSTSVLRPVSDEHYRRQYTMPNNARRSSKTRGRHRRCNSSAKAPRKKVSARKRVRSNAGHIRRHSHFTVTRVRSSARAVSMEEPTLEDEHENQSPARRRRSKKSSGLPPKPSRKTKDSQVRQLWQGLPVRKPTTASNNQPTEERESCTPEGQPSSRHSTAEGRTEGEVTSCTGLTTVDIFIEDHKVEDDRRTLMIDNLASILTQLCDAVHTAYKNDDDGIKRVTRKYAAVFSSTSIYKNIREFLQQLSDEARFESACLVNVLVYISRLLRKRNFVITWFSIHRIILTCVMLADKSISDIHTSTAKYAWVTGTQKIHMTMMEKRLLRCLKWETVVFHNRHKKAEEYLLKTDTFTAKMPVF